MTTAATRYAISKIARRLTHCLEARATLSANPTVRTIGAIDITHFRTALSTTTAQCLTNIQAILEQAGSSLDKIVSATIVLANEDDFAGMNEEWLRWFPANPPARQGAKLPARIPGLKISIAAIAEA
jgi:enamine deaminase RidA (YjgF/YER057c/UK114 family)